MQHEQLNKICSICSNITQSLEYLDDAIGDHSPIHPPTVSVFRPNNKINNGFELQNSEVISIQDDINAFTNPFAHYKCFKCYGIHSTNIGFSQTLCDECQGSEYIRQCHPMAKLLQKVLKATIPSMKSLSKSGVQCHECEIWRERDDYYQCDHCSEFSLCSKCYQQEKSSHPKDHRLQLKRTIPENLSFRLRQTIPTMKKISEVFQLEENNNDEQLQCSICRGSFDECYMACTTCESQGAGPHHVCLNCFDSPRMRHSQQHVLEVRTHSRESMLPGLSAKPSNSSTTGLESTDELRSNWPLRENLKKTNGSIVEFGQMDLDQSTEMQDEGRFSQTQDWPVNANSSFIDITTDDACNPETPEAVNYVKKCAIGRNQSMVAISMQQSVQPCDLFLHVDRKIPSHALLGYTLRNNGDQLLSKSTTDDQYVFTNYQCDICQMLPIRKKRYHCNICQNYDLCIQCYLTSVKEHPHSDFTEVDGNLIRKKRDERLEKVRDSSIRGRNSIRLSTASVRL